MLLVEDPDVVNSEEKSDSFRATFDAEFKLDTGLTRLTRHIKTKRWRRHPSFNPNEVTRVADELSKMKRGAPVPDRFELVEVHEPVVPPTVVEAPKLSLGPRPAAPTASVTPAPIPIPKAAAATPTPLRVNTTLPPTTIPSTNTGSSMVGQSPAVATPATPATPATGKVVFKFGKKAAAAPPTGASSPASSTPASGPSAAVTPSMTPVPTYAPPTQVAPPTHAAPPQHAVHSSSAMDVDLPPPTAAPAAQVPAVASSAPAAPSGAGREQYEAKLAQRTDLARRKVAEEANRARLAASLPEQKNAMIRKRIQDNITNVANTIAKLDAQIAELDRELLQLGA